MKKKILNYIVVVEPDKRTGTNAPCYVAYCPTLGLADDGDTIEEALERIQELIRFHLKTLKKENEIIPIGHLEKSLVTTVQVAYPNH